MVGSAALEREVLVELLEDRLHPLTVADPVRGHSGDAPKRFRSEIFQRSISVDGHRHVGLGQQ